MKKALFLLLCLLCFCFSGCMSRHVEEQLLVIVMGLDETAAGDMTVTVKVPSNSEGGQSAASNAENGGSQMGYLTLKATGHHLADTLELLQATTPRSLNFSQIRQLVISRKLAEKDRFNLLLQQLYALPRMHTQAVVVICEENAAAFVEEQKPYVGLRLSRYIEVSLHNYTGKGFVPTTTLTTAVKDMSLGWQDPLLILGATAAEETPDPSPENILNVDAGSLQKTSVNKIKLYGAAATDGVKVCGTLTGYEMALVNLLRGGAQALNLTDENGFPLPVYARAPATLKMTTEGDPALSLSLVCEVRYPAGFAPDEEKIARRLEEEIARVIRKLQAMKSDPLGFGGIAVRRFLTVRDWENFHFREKYASAGVDVQVQIRLKKE